MPAARHWISVRPVSLDRIGMSALTSLALLTVATLAFAARLVLCQVQAYVLLALGVVSLLLYVRADCAEHEHSVVALRSPWCIDCSGVSRAAILSGARATRVRSNYERLYWAAPRPYLMLGVWLAWIAYGSLFHSAAHQAHEDEFVAQRIRSLWHGWDAANASIAVALLRAVRKFFLLGGALYSLLADYFSALTAPQRSSPGVWHVHVATLFFALLFAPTSGATAQALDTVSLLARTHVFAALFFVSEQIDAEIRYWSWVAQYDSSYRRMLVSVQMALGLAESRSLKSTIDAENIIPDRPPILSGTRLSIAVPAARLAVIVRSAWILFADNSMLFYAALQLVLSLVLVWKLRVRIQKAVVSKDSYLRLVGVSAPTTPMAKISAANGFAHSLRASAMERGELPSAAESKRENFSGNQQQCPPERNANAPRRSTQPDVDVRRRWRPQSAVLDSSPPSPKPPRRNATDFPRSAKSRRPSQVRAADELAEFMSQNDEEENGVDERSRSPLKMDVGQAESRHKGVRDRQTPSPPASSRQRSSPKTQRRLSTINSTVI